MRLTQNDTDFLQSLLALVDSSASPIELEEVRSCIHTNESRPINGGIREWVTQLECVLGIFARDRWACRDLFPEKPQAVKLEVLIAEGKKMLKGKYELERLFSLYPRFITVNALSIEVEELAKENYGFILYRAVETEIHYLEVVRNHSAAHWEETVLLTAEEADEFRSAPSYEFALTLLASHKA